MFLWKCACSMQARGWADADIEQEVRELNARMVDAGNDLFTAGPIDEKRLIQLLKEVKKLDKGTPAEMSYDVIARFNETWAIMMVNGRVEFLHRPTGVCYPQRDFTLRTAPERVQIKGKPAALAPIWIRDIDRLEYDGICIESPDYGGPAYNVFQGWACEAEDGDASLWEDYIQRILCSDDANLAHWVMSYLADGVQRPWSVHPGSAVALRGGQGGGKSFLGNALRKFVGPAHAQEISQSDRMFAQFNRGLFGSTFVLAEESLFAGSKAQAATAKSFVTSDIWTYEQKYLASNEFPSEEEAYHLVKWSNDNLYGIDKDDIGVKLTKAIMVAMRDGSTHVLLGDAVRTSLWPTKFPKLSQELGNPEEEFGLEQFTVAITNPPFGNNLKVKASDCRASKYSISTFAAMKGPNDFTNLEIGLVYLEQCHRLLQVGGRLGIVLPETYFFSYSYRWLPYWLEGRFALRGMLNIPMEAFEEFCRAKTNFYIFEKIGNSSEAFDSSIIPKKVRKRGN